VNTSLLRAVRGGTVGLVVVLALAGCGTGSGSSSTSGGAAAASSPTASPVESVAASEQADLTADPSDTGKRVDSPVAVARDCWNRANDTYEKVGCTEPHNAEVLAVAPLTLKQYQAAQKTAKKKQSPPAWAEAMALALCRKFYSPKKLAAGVKEASTDLSYISPTSVTTEEDSWNDTAQAVCLVNLKPGKTTTKKILK